MITHNKELGSINIHGDDYPCYDEELNQWSFKHMTQTPYRIGAIATKEDPNKPQRWGCIGEIATAWLLDGEVNVKAAECGKTPHDIIVNGVTFDAKVTGTNTIYIKVMNPGSNRIIDLKSDFYVAYKMINDDLKNGTALIGIGGVMPVERILTKYWKIVDSPRGDWKNIEIPFSAFDPTVFDPVSM